MKLEQAARQALAMLEEMANLIGADKNGKTITALRDALAEPELNLNCKSVQKRLATVWGYVKAEQTEQEPVAEVVLRNQTIGFGRKEERKDIKFLADVEVGTKLYAAPVQQVDLTDDEIYKLADDVDWAAGAYLGFARAVIAAYKEKNK